MNRSIFSLSPIGGEGRGEGALWFMVPTRVKDLRFSLSWTSVTRAWSEIFHTTFLT